MMSFFGKDDVPVGKAHDGKSETAPVFALVQQVRGYWQALCVAGQAPMRAQIDPRGLNAALGQTFLAERVAPGVGRLRVAGMGLADLLGMELRGMPLSCLIDPASRAQVAAGLDLVVDHGAVVEMDLSAAGSFGRPALRARLVLLPLRDEDGGTHRILGCLEVVGAIGRAPRRFAVEACRSSAMDGIAKPMLRVAVPLGNAAPKVAFEVEATKSSRSYLQLVKK